MSQEGPYRTPFNSLMNFALFWLFSPFYFMVGPRRKKSNSSKDTENHVLNSEGPGPEDSIH